MSDVFDTLQERYQTLVARKEKGETGKDFLKDVSGFIADAQQAGATIADVDERSQLRAWMRFLANVLYDATGAYPDTSLQPLARGQLVASRLERGEKPAPSFPLAWMLVGGAAVIVIAVGLAIIGGMGRQPTLAPAPTSTLAPTLTSTPVPFVSHAAVGIELDEGGALEMTAGVFCLGTSDVIAEFTLEGVRPETEWHWEVQRDGEIVAAQPATPWGRETQTVTIHALTGGSEGVEAGHYDLLIYVGEQIVGTQSFQVFDVAPRIFNPWVADVPAPAGGASGEGEFEVGVRVIYLNYDYEGLCPGLNISHVLYREGESIQESVETWSGAPQGKAQVSFQAPDDLPFPPGDYEITVAIAGEEQARVEFTIRGEAEVHPAFGDVTIALGVRPDGTPILTAPDSRFDWNTKVIYAIFDYVGMRDGLAWMAVWSRSGKELAREEHFWDVETGGTEGTRWVAYYDESGRALPGGSYSVTLYIENVAQSTAEFNILYYVPRQ